jgi:hypothetical protein
MRAPRAALGLILGQSAPLPSATPAQAALRLLAAGPHPKTGRRVGRRGLHPRPSAATVQSRLLSRLDLDITPGRGLAAEAALVLAGPGASLPPRARAGRPGRSGRDRQAGVAFQPRRNRLERHKLPPCPSWTWCRDPSGTRSPEEAAGSRPPWPPGPLRSSRRSHKAGSAAGEVHDSRPVTSGGRLDRSVPAPAMWWATPPMGSPPPSRTGCCFGPTPTRSPPVAPHRAW